MVMVTVGTQSSRFEARMSLSTRITVMPVRLRTSSIKRQQNNQVEFLIRNDDYPHVAVHRPNKPSNFEGTIRATMLLETRFLAEGVRPNSLAYLIISLAAAIAMCRKAPRQEPIALPIINSTSAV